MPPGRRQAKWMMLTIPATLAMKYLLLMPMLYLISTTTAKQQT